jgi:peptidoglycan hydrolase CwlO-like protein
MSGTLPDDPLTDAEIASLAQRGLLFDNIEENTRARDEALARMAADAEANVDGLAARMDAARDHVAAKRKEMLAKASKEPEEPLTDRQKAERDDRMRLHEEAQKRAAAQQAAAEQQAAVPRPPPPLTTPAPPPAAAASTQDPNRVKIGAGMLLF